MHFSTSSFTFFKSLGWKNTSLFTTSLVDTSTWVDKAWKNSVGANTIVPINNEFQTLNWTLNPGLSIPKPKCISSKNLGLQIYE